MLRTFGIIVVALALVWVVVRTFMGDMGYGYFEVTGEGKAINQVSVCRFELNERTKALADATALARSDIDKARENAALTDTERAERIAEAESLIAENEAASATLAKTVHFSWSRTIGIWLAAFFTLCIMSFLYKDNPLYRFAEHTFVGASAAYWMVVTFWNMAIPIAIGRLFPRFVKFNLAPGHPLDSWVEKLAAENWLAKIVNYEAVVGSGLNAPWYQLMNWWYWIPMAFGVMLLWRLAPTGQWISRWPLAFIIGGTAGIRMVGFLQADFVAQIRSSITPLFVLREAGGNSLAFQQAFYCSMNSIILLLGMITVLIYFFFSLEHKGVVGRISRVGIWVLMITFGAGFGFTVMGRIALLVGRFQFLVQDWINYSP
ncbi:MAG: hypothetical protein JXO22_17015 [Phycisphaerae bacterium]|nr:hypothetical protein [Phycisphaerae bacterium]